MNPTTRIFAAAWLALGVTPACGTNAGARQIASTEAAQAAVTAGDSNMTPLDANQTLGLERVLPLLQLVPMHALMGLARGCDPNAQRDHQTVCGHDEPTNAHASWTACTLPSPFERGAVPTSSGSVNITATITPDTSVTCDANTVIRATRDAQYTLQASGPRGGSMNATGQNSETSSRNAVTGATTAQLTLDVSQRFVDASGVVRGQVQINGTVAVQTDAGGRHADQVLDGNLHVVDANGAASTVVLTALHRASPRDCPWPVGGTVVRTNADGSTHQLTFTATCGHASRDGVEVVLPEPPHPHGGRGGPGRHDGPGRRRHDGSRGPRPGPWGE